MVYESEFYTRRPYTSTYTSSRPTISSYTLTSRYHYYDDDYYTPSYYTPSFRYLSSPLSVRPTYSRIGSYYRPSLRFSYDDDDYPTEIGYSTASTKSYVPLPLTRITTSPSRVYRSHVSPVRIVTSPARYYRRDAYSPVRVITSPSRIISNRVRPSVLSREFDRIERKYRARSLEYDAKDDWLNSSYSSTFNDETRDIRANTNRLLREVNEPVPRAQYTKQYTWNRFDDVNENEQYVNKNILRPTRNTRDQIAILSALKYRDDLPKRFGISHLAAARIVGDLPFYSRRNLAHEYDPLDFIIRSVKSDVYYQSYIGKDHIALGKARTDGDNKPLVIVKPSIVKDEKISTVIDSSTLETKEELKA